MGSDIDQLFRCLADSNPLRVADAVQELLDSSVPLAGSPPSELLTALLTTKGHQFELVLNLARAWSRQEMSRFALNALQSTQRAEDRERIARLLKTVLAAENVSEAIKLVLDGTEEAQFRRWLLEGLARLAFGGELGWEQVSHVVAKLAVQHQSTLRSGLVSLLTALPWRPENTRLLEPFLLDQDHEVSSAAVSLLVGHPDAARELKLEVIDHLRLHSNPMMRHGAAELEKARKSTDI